ncbi:2-hydroxyglutaryl-CoA dehydratase, D-component [Ruminiclostridium hungatei]|uniref:2-hydroxyglutaryl-CoA dehydratase, D-component n=1 Tax=Ruminiclostridium hungatei TaxID=48256 RepID=A0A1V4SNW7_RUMHU|nr:2-hydroxyacyl-CoA dehydratase [Ruminiclostridium hungatei]OPX44941.1 2-hydroxyglutaryl-CoA dehydratase, D-component [Ruminiclostridium hungatei]
MKQIGITTTVPVEVLLAAGYKVIDINNLFISAESYFQDIERAERDGFPKSSCAWIKGLYGACLRYGICEIVGVSEGDCSNTKALLEVLRSRGVRTYDFSYPSRHSLKDVTAGILRFMEDFGVTQQQAEAEREVLKELRRCARTIDELTYSHNKASGFENHLYQVSLSDFNGDSGQCLKELKDKILEIEKRAPQKQAVRLGYMGVPPMTCDLYDYVEGFNARVVFNEVQREFAFPRFEAAESIYHQYYDYTYPYHLNFRLQEVKKQIELRKLDGIIHYTQAFCHRAIEDIVIKKELDIPVLTIEGDKANRLDSRTKLRLEAFLDMLWDMKEGFN